MMYPLQPPERDSWHPSSSSAPGALQWGEEGGCDHSWSPGQRPWLQGSWALLGTLQPIPSGASLRQPPQIH